jgi:HAD superfamily hydrolase (TIGR01549 family)
VPVTRRLDVVLFDLDDTLHDDTYAYSSAAEEVAREVAAEHGIDALALKAAYIAEAEGFWHRLSPLDLTVKLAGLRASMWQAALESVGLDDPNLAHRSAERYNAYRVKYFTLFPGAVALLRSLRERGIKLGIVTNGLSETHREKIALLQIGEYFDAIFLSDEVGMVKPDPLLFAHACRTLGGAPAHAAMVGDRYDRDIRGATEAGLYTIWLNVRNEELPPGAAPPDATCSSIGEVARILLEPAGVS